jgi:mannose/cellobiose epimerase-like protein (N-acyl-D-glucosamine 2-epimerase family)
LSEEYCRDWTLTPTLARALGRLFDVFCRPELDGGWMDRVDMQDRPLSTFMPASTLYHVYFAVAQLESNFAISKSDQKSATA